MSLLYNWLWLSLMVVVFCFVVVAIFMLLCVESDLEVPAILRDHPSKIKVAI